MFHAGALSGLFWWARERIQREKQEAGAGAQEAAGEARTLFAGLPIAIGERALRGGVVACLEGDQMQGEDGRLVLPVVNGEGEQVAGEGRSLFPKRSL